MRHTTAIILCASLLLMGGCEGIDVQHGNLGPVTYKAGTWARPLPGSVPEPRPMHAFFVAKIREQFERDPADALPPGVVCDGVFVLTDYNPATGLGIDGKHVPSTSRHVFALWVRGGKLIPAEYKRAVEGVPGNIVRASSREWYAAHIAHGATVIGDELTTSFTW